MGTPPTSWLQIAGLIVTWVAILAGGLWWIVSGYPKLRGELQQEIERLFAAGSLREQVKTMIAEEIARRVDDAVIVDEVTRAVENRMRERRVKRAQETSAVVRADGEHINGRAVLTDTLVFVDAAHRGDNRS